MLLRAARDRRRGADRTGTLRAEGYARGSSSAAERRARGEEAGRPATPRGAALARARRARGTPGCSRTEQPADLTPAPTPGAGLTTPAPVEFVRSPALAAGRCRRPALARRRRAHRGRPDAQLRAARRRARGRAVPPHRAADHGRGGGDPDRRGRRARAPRRGPRRWGLRARGQVFLRYPPCSVRRHADRGGGRARRGRRQRTGSGDGAAAARGRREVTIADLNAERGQALADELGARFVALRRHRRGAGRGGGRGAEGRCGSRSPAPGSAGRRTPASAARTRSSRSRR